MGIGKFQPPTQKKIDTPEPINKKLGTVDYVQETTPYTKFGTNTHTGGFRANGWNNNKNYFLFIYTFLSRVSILTRDIDIANLSVRPSVRLSVMFQY